jgi:hypothetical protein
MKMTDGIAEAIIIGVLINWVLGSVIWCKLCFAFIPASAQDPLTIVFTCVVFQFFVHIAGVTAICVLLEKSSKIAP